MNDINNIKDEILDIININIEKVEIKAQQANEDLSQLGMDSIIFIKIVVALEETFMIEIPDEKLLITEMGTVNKMINVVSSVLRNTNK